MKNIREKIFKAVYYIIFDMVNKQKNDRDNTIEPLPWNIRIALPQPKELRSDTIDFIEEIDQERLQSE